MRKKATSCDGGLIMKVGMFVSPQNSLRIGVEQNTVLISAEVAVLVRDEILVGFQTCLFRAASALVVLAVGEPDHIQGSVLLAMVGELLLDAGHELREVLIHTEMIPHG